MTEEFVAPPLSPRHTALAEVVRRHLPEARLDREPPEHHAAWLNVAAIAGPPGDVFDEERTAAALADMERHARDLARFWESLPHAVRFEVGRRLPGLVPDDPDLKARGWTLDAISHLPRVLATAVAEVRPMLAEGRKPGRRDWVAVQFVATARAVWRARRGKEAPAHGLNEASPFGRFLADAFEAAGITGTPRAAFDSWASSELGRK